MNSVKSNDMDQMQNKIYKHVFICGCGHSGTSLLLALLSSHPMCHGIEIETGMFCSHLDLSSILKRIEYYDEIAIKEGKCILVEKTPRHVHSINFILNNIMDAYILVCVRNPFDVVASLLKRDSDFWACIHRYISDNMSWVQLGQDHRVRVIRYEDLVTNPEIELSAICDVINIPFKKEMMEYYKCEKLYFGGKKAKKTDGIGRENHIMLRNWQLKQPLTDKMIGEWRLRIGENEYMTIYYALRETVKSFGYDFTSDYMVMR